VVMSEARFQVYQDKNGKFRFLLRDPSNKIITVSEPCDTVDECFADVEAIKQYASAPVEELMKLNNSLSQTRTDLQPITLILNDPAQQFGRDYVIKGTDITFTGQLLLENQGISEAAIQICDSDRSFLCDDVLATGVTDSSGMFQIPWHVTGVDWLDITHNIYDTVEVYARFPGSSRYQPAMSKQYTVFLRERAVGIVIDAVHCVEELGTDWMGSNRFYVNVTVKDGKHPESTVMIPQRTATGRTPRFLVIDEGQTVPINKRVYHVDDVGDVLTLTFTGYIQPRLSEAFQAIGSYQSQWTINDYWGKGQQHIAKCRLIEDGVVQSGLDIYYTITS
jgi:uncharacterized protein YegP (UPF0339 family)